MKENDYWEKPYVYKKPDICFVVDRPPGKEHNLLQKSFAVINEHIDSKCNKDEREANITVISGRLPAGNVLIFPQTVVDAGYRKVWVI